MKRAVIYARFSSQNQRDESIEEQIAVCRNYIGDKFSIVGIFKDEAVSGRTDRRKGYQDLKRGAEQGKFDVVVAYKSSRISRNLLNAIQFMAKMKECGVEVLFAKEDYGDNAQGRMMLNIMMSFNQFYSENLSEDVKRSMKANAEKCRVNGLLPYGYKNVDGHPQINEDEAKIVRKMFDMALDGNRHIDIAEYLNSVGIRTRYGKKWDSPSVSHILANEKYSGVYSYDDVVIEGGMPSIVTLEEIEKAKKCSRKNKYRKRSEFMLSGKLFCGHCGSPMAGVCGTSATGKIYKYYSCYGHRKKTCKKKDVPKDYIEDLVISAIKEHILNDESIEKLADMCINDDNTNEIKSLEQRIAEVEKKARNIVDKIADGEDFIMDKLHELTAERDELREQLKSITPKLQVNREDIVSYLNEIRNYDGEMRGGLVKAFVRRVYVFDDKLKLILDPIDGGEPIDIDFSTVRNNDDGGAPLCKIANFIICTVPFAKKERNS